MTPASEYLRVANCENGVQVKGGTQARERTGPPVVHDPGPVSPVRAWLTALLLLIGFVLIGLHLSPILALVVAVLLADPLLALFADMGRPHRHKRPMMPEGRP